MPTILSKEGFAGLTLPAAGRRMRGGGALWQQLLAKMICLARLNQVYAQAATATDCWEFAANLLQILQVKYEVEPADLRHIPRQGPLIVVANHPFGGIEGIILLDLLGQVRRDLKLLANYLLRQIKEFQELFIYVDPFGQRDSVHANLSGLRQARAWLQQGGVVAVFPAGEVSHLHLGQRRVMDPDWNPAVEWLLRQSEASVLPLFFAGHNGFFFQTLGLLHPLLRTLLLPRETLNKSGKTIRVKVGQLIRPKIWQQLGSREEIMTYLRLRTYLLQGETGSLKTPKRFFALPRCRPKPKPAEIIAPVCPATLAAEVAHLPREQLLVVSGTNQVYYAQAEQIPCLLQEIGRLREITFRAVGEGTGRPLDQDRFDAHYLHLFVWEVAKQEVVGAYRLGLTDQILATQGKNGLYTSTLFNFTDKFLQDIQPALELGRSFVRREYQKNYAALLLLWKGIGRFLVQRPHYRYLFGAVSISNSYSELAQGLLTTWLRLHTFWPELAQNIKPRHPLQLKSQQGQELRLVLAGTDIVEELSTLLADIDPQRRGVPILLKQYLKLGGKILGFNRDPHFNQALDALILVDLEQTPVAVLQRYMGQDGWAKFAGYRRAKTVPYLLPQKEQPCGWQRADLNLPAKL